MSDELNETHGHEVNQLKEELQLKDAAMAKVMNNAEKLKVHATEVMETKQNLLAECQKLKEELQLKDAAMAKVMNNAEQLKVHVTELMETKQNILAECQKLKEDCAHK